MGAYEPEEIEISVKDGHVEIPLGKQKKSFLVKMASNMGIPTAGKTKAEIIAAIIEQGGAPGGQ